MGAGRCSYILDALMEDPRLQNTHLISDSLSPLTYEIVCVHVSLMRDLKTAQTVAFLQNVQLMRFVMNFHDVSFLGICMSVEPS